ncbi:MAG: class I SAM-dependent methyltransferase [Acidobacteria bacterium]|nr:class I SAM-dependent methyltransferase [Acidobacteriota bacterium]
MKRRSVVLTIAFAALGIAAGLAEDTFQAETERLAKLLDWQAGSAIADVGAGDGEITLLLSERVGAAGHVYSTEIDDAKLARLEKLTAERKNVTVLKAGAEESNLPPGGCDSIVVRRVYHHFPNPTKMNASFLAALKPGGTLAIIDFEDREALPQVHENVPKNRGHHGISRSIIIEELTAAGFKPGPHPADWTNGDYCLIFRKPNK